ncbi:MAG: GldG family protein [bacterium]|nr:GldG family protein [bacterium]
MKNRWTRSLTLQLLGVAAIVAALNLLVAPLSWRIDITQEQLYSLSPGTQKIAEELKHPVTLKLYFSSSAAGVPLQYKSYGQRVREVLAEYQRLNPDKISLRVFDPKPDSDEELWADKYGLKGADLGNGSRFFLGLAGQSEERERALPFLDPRSESSLEYDLSELILRLQSEVKPKLGLISSLPVLGSEPDAMARLSGAQPRGPWAVFGELSRAYEIEPIEAGAPIEDDITLLMVLHPKQLSDAAQYRIEQYLLKGGKLMVFVDPHARADQVAQQMGQMGQAVTAASDLPKLFEAWGVDYNAAQILGDLDRAAQVNAGGAAVPFALWQTLGIEAINQEMPPTKGLEKMLVVEPGGFRLTENSPLSLEPLLSASDKAGLVDSTLLRYMGPLQLNQKVETAPKPLYLAALLKGKPKSAFDQVPDFGDQPAPGPHLAQAQQSVFILLVADVDFLFDRFAVDAFNLLGQTIVQPKNDNLGFFLNLTEFFSGADELMSIRSRGRFSRPFERFEALEQAASQRYQQAEAELNAELQQVQAKLAELDRQQGPQSAGLSAEQLAEVQQFRDKEKETKGELRQIRKLLRQGIESEITWLTLLNLLLVPMGLVGFSVWVYRRRFKRGF